MAQQNIAFHVADELDTNKSRHRAELLRSLLQQPHLYPEDRRLGMVPQSYALAPIVTPGASLINYRAAGLDSGAASTDVIPIMTLNLKDLIINDDWYLQVEEVWVDSSTGTPQNASLGIWLAPTIAGSDAVSFADVANSFGLSGTTVRVEADVTRDITNIPSAGSLLATEFAPFASNAVPHLWTPNLPRLAGKDEELVFSAQNLASGQQTFIISVKFRLLYLPQLPNA